MYLNNYSIWLWMEWRCHTWDGAPSCCLEMLGKFQKHICMTVGPSFDASLESLSHCWNVASLSLFYRHFLGRCSSKVAQLVTSPYSRGKRIDFMTLQSLFLDVLRMSVSTVPFLAQLISGIFYLYNASFDLWSMLL